MTPEKLEELRRLALAAQELHPGEWVPVQDSGSAFSAVHAAYPGLPPSYAGSMYPEWLREFVLAAQPSVVLELLREIDVLKDFLEKAAEIPPNPLSRLLPELLAPIEETEVVPDEPVPEGPPDVQIGDIVWFFWEIETEPFAGLVVDVLDRSNGALGLHVFAPGRRQPGPRDPYFEAFWSPTPKVDFWTVRDPALLPKREAL